MEKLLADIKIILDYLINNTDNPFIISTSKMIDEKLNQIRNRDFHTQESVDYFCNYIIDKDIDKMKRVITSETKIEYSKMDELTQLIYKIKEQYFN